MIKNIFVFVLVCVVVVFIVQYFLEDYIATDERLTSEQIAFKSDLTESLNNLSTLSECNLSSQNIADVISCMRTKSSAASSIIDKYQNKDGCFGDIANEIASISSLVNEFSDISMKISEGGDFVEEEKVKASNVLESISNKITVVSELNNQDVCLLDRIN